jgi:hypothetical protein
MRAIYAAQANITRVEGKAGVVGILLNGVPTFFDEVNVEIYCHIKLH